MYRVVFIDSDASFVTGLCDRIHWAEYGCEVAGSAGSAAAGMALIRSVRPHIVFSEITMPDGDVSGMLADLRGEFPAMRVTILTGCRDMGSMQRVVRLGVTRLLWKPPPAAELLEALRAMTEELKGVDNTPPRYDCAAEENSTSRSFVVRQAVAYMEQEYARKLTLRDVADHCFVSPWYLSRLMHRYIQKNFYDVLNSIRIEQAKRLLSDSRLKIGEIVELVGYSDSTHFAHTFKKLVGMSANQYRNQYRGQGREDARREMPVFREEEESWRAWR